MAQQHVVGVAVDAAMGYGRGILRGVLRFANTRRNWLLHEDLHATVANSAAADALPECDGVIIATDHAVLIRRIRGHARFVVNCSEGGEAGLLPVVCVDDEAVGRMAAEHLMGCHLKRFACCGPAGVESARFRAFRERLLEADLPCVIFPTYRPVRGESGREKPAQGELVEWLRGLPKPVGVFAWDDMGAREVAGACKQGGIRVPDEVAILGVNNDDLLCESAWPPLSSIEVDFSQIGYLAARLLDRLLNGELLLPQEERICIPPRGVEQRQSTHLLAVNDPDVAHALELIRERACGVFTVGDLLRVIPLARRTLERRFIEKLGRSPHEEITRVRTEMAQRLLRETDETLPRIAEKCGFSAPQALNYMFRKMVGQTPAAYRRLHRGAGN